MNTTRVPRPIRRSTVAIALAGVAVLVIGAPVSAHDELGGSTPAKDEQVDRMPTEVELRFGGTPLEIGATVIVADADGEDWADGAPEVRDGVVTAAVRDGAPDGFYQVRWRIVSGDGAVVSGHFGFGVGDTSDAEPIPPPRSDDAVAQRPPGADAAGDFELNAAEPLPGAAPQAAEGEPLDLLRLLGTAVLGAAAALGAALLVSQLAGRLQRRRPPTTTPEPLEGS
jgi:methionine-rich copper-binding protein CopC